MIPHPKDKYIEKGTEAFEDELTRLMFLMSQHADLKFDIEIEDGRFEITVIGHRLKAQGDAKMLPVLIDAPKKMPPYNGKNAMVLNLIANAQKLADLTKAVLDKDT